MRVTFDRGVHKTKIYKNHDISRLFYSCPYSVMRNQCVETVLFPRQKAHLTSCFHDIVLQKENRY